MVNRTTTKLLAKGLLCAACSLFFTACIDDKYDMDSVDMTMGLGSEGLGMTLGATEDIKLKDMLNVDEDDLWAVDGNNLFYLVQHGTTSFNYHIGKADIYMDKVALQPEFNIFDYNRMGLTTQVTLSGGQSLKDLGYSVPEATAKEAYSLDMVNVDENIKYIKRIAPEKGSSRFRLTLEIKANNGNADKLCFKSVKDLKVTFPFFIRSEKFPNQVYTVDLNGKDLSSGKVDLGWVDIDEFVFVENPLPDDTEIPENETEEHKERRCGKKVSEGTIDLRGDFVMDGKFELAAKQGKTVTLGAGSYINVVMHVVLEGEETGGGKIAVSPERVSGIYGPKVDVGNIDPLNIADELPDFLKDESVVIDVTNPTVKFNLNMEEVPMSFEIKGMLYGVDKADVPTCDPVLFPAEGTRCATLRKYKRFGVYFYQGESPYDPEGASVVADKHNIPNLTDLIMPIPQSIRVEMPEGSVNIKPDEVNTVGLDRDYNSDIDYDVYIPFEFNSKLNILYRDTTDCMNDDLKDYQSKGITITANAHNTVPLKLVAELLVLDVNGNVIPLAQPALGYIDAAPGNDASKETLFSADIIFKDPADLSRTDRFVFRITAAADQPETQSRKLLSSQYLKLSKILLRLNGPIIGDFN